MWYYSFVDFLNSYLRFVCTCMFAPTTNDQIYPDISYISPFYLHTKADVTKINILSDYIFSHSGFNFFFFICSWYTLRLSWCNIYSRIGPVHNNWHQCVLNWRCFFFLCWCRRYSSVADDFYYFTESWKLFQNIYLSIYTGIYS